ncbi:LPS export ABC transporter periplasmic protein LptC [Pseudomonas sp. TTU2014-080ASC]|uniref:LPS export ABC transporter periplasmic protein LptC n=1 Tax=Pseudomonas sp. TTU2014-080ASC TaxID=1729724 RepID=UPI0007189477|nr:LPS export ABC transporter periplasmic protein LptC [Pseudomonas sp. TTU2014-080ASC]KRW57468.1 LPS export ABC transporter periplasmic protein LptC [Pseudomonas sp. TTU2014-080ASC]
MQNKAVNYAILVIAVLLVGAFGYWKSPGKNTDPAVAGTAEQTIDFYATNTYTIEFQEDGTLNYELTADKVEHIKATDITLVSNPYMELYQGKELPWKIRSLRSEVSPGGKEIELIDNVHVERIDAKNRPTTLTTTRLTVFPEKEFAQTAQAVKIDTANGVTTAVGMKAYLNDGRMLLLSNVRGQHEAR